MLSMTMKMAGFHFRVYMYAVLMTCSWSPCETFLMDSSSDCVVAQPCTCGNNIINCDYKRLTAIPAIYPFSNSPQSALQLHFNSNILTDLPSNVFRNISQANFTSIELSLRYNQITTISDQAFNGIENRTTYLNLENNQLTSIPSAIGHLVNLQTLCLTSNPIRTLDAQVLAGIHENLNILHVSFGSMTSWPDELNVLSELQELHIDHLPLRSLPSDAFHGFETTLHTFVLTNTDLQRIPDAICNLTHLRKLVFDDNALSNGNTSLQELCHNHPLTEVTHLSLDIDNIYSFPGGLLTIFPNLNSLYMVYNHLRHIPFEFVPENNQITYLNLMGNNFSSIPASIERFQMLQTLDLSRNEIKHLEDNDLSGLPYLATLSLYANPLEYIAPDAFRSQQHSLTYVYVYQTLLRTISSAFTSLQNLTQLRVYKSPMIECSCDSMSQLRSWDVSRVDISGQCESSMELIKDYILTSLPHCPIR